MNMPKVSVVIPIYNVEPYLRECLDSVVNQTLQDIEIICVDDGSTDGSLAILEEYEKQDERIKVFSQENKGQSAARNVGLEIAIGDYVYFMDSDDLIELNCLELLYSISIKNNLDILYFDADVFFESKELEKQHGNYSCYYDRKHRYEKVYLGEELFSEMLCQGDYKPSPCLQFLKNSFLKENNVNFFEGIIHEDNLFTFQSIMLADRVSHIDRKLFYRRVRENSTMTKKETSKNVIGYFTCFIEMLKFGLKYDIKNDAVKRHITSIFHNTQNKYNNLAELERKKIKWEKNTFENFMFQYLIKNPAPRNVNLNGTLGGTAERCEALQSQLNMIYQSKAYRLGQLLTYIPRKFRGGIRCYQEHGLRYTVWRLKEKIMTKFPKWKRTKNFTNNVILKEDEDIAVSVIVPVYNVEKYLEQCLDSLLAQTFKNFEIICVNDGSTDNCEKILEKYRRTDSRIKVIKQFNQGLGFARNTGLKNANGEYIIFIDSDDFVEADLLEKTYYKAKNTNSDIVVFKADIYEHQLEKFTSAPWMLLDYKIPAKDTFNWIDMKKDIFTFSNPNVWTKLYRGDFLKENNLIFSPLKSAEDLPHTYYAFILATRISLVNKVLIHYRKGITSNISSNKDDKALIFYDAYALWQMMLLKEGVYEDVKQSFVNRCLMGCVYEITSLKTVKAKNILKQYLKDEIVYKFDLYNKPEAYFYNEKDFAQLKDLLSDCELWQADDVNVKISIIIPVYNAEKYLGQCLDNLLNQTLKEFEIICVNDGSTDNSLEILKKYKNIDKRIQVYSQENSYAGVARNSGMRKAKGKYLLFLDADDFFECELLEKLYEKCEDTKADIAICGADKYNDSTKQYSEAPWEVDTNVLPQTDYFTPEDIPKHIFTFCTSVPWNKMFRKEYIKGLHIYFQNNRCANDLSFVMNAMFQAEKITFMEDVLVHYRIGMESNLQANSDKAPFDFCRALLAVQTELFRNGKYELFKQSFSNLALNNSMYNLNRLQNNEQIYEHLCKKLKEFWFPLFEIDNHDETYFFNRRYWNEYEQLRYEKK